MKDFSDTKPMGLYEAAIGERNQNYYLSRFEDFDEKGPGFHASWNWAAFFFTGFWSLYRKMYGWCFAWWAVGTVLTVYSKVQNSEINQILGIVVGALWLSFALYANALYHRKIKSRIVSAQKWNSDASRLSRRLSAGGGVHMWVPIGLGGLFVLGIVAAVALPAYQDYTKRRVVLAPFGQNDKIANPPAAPQAAEHGPWEDYQKGTPAPKQTIPYEVVQYNEALAAFTRRDYDTALNVLRPIATQGHTASQSLLATMYRSGTGVVQDYTEAVRWYRLAAEHGDRSGQTNLGTMYYEGRGVAQNYHEATRWYRLAAEQGDWYAQGLLGEAYASGQGIVQDVVRAHMWLNLATASGSLKQQVESRNAVENVMTPQQIAQAQQMARACQQRNFKGCD